MRNYEVTRPWRFTVAHTILVALIIGTLGAGVGAIFGCFSNQVIDAAIKCGETAAAIGACIGFAVGFRGTPQGKRLVKKLFEELD